MVVGNGVNHHTVPQIGFMIQYNSNRILAVLSNSTATTLLHCQARSYKGVPSSYTRDSMVTMRDVDPEISHGHLHAWSAVSVCGVHSRWILIKSNSSVRRDRKETFSHNNRLTTIQCWDHRLCSIKPVKGYPLRGKDGHGIRSHSWQPLSHARGPSKHPRMVDAVGTW